MASPIERPTMTDEAWPFDGWLSLAVRRFGLSPSEFWAMSFKDWRALIQEPVGQSLSRAQFQELSQLYPDIENEEKYAD